MTDVALGPVPWSFLQANAELFYVSKGILAVVATVAVVAHMLHTWHQVSEWGQRLRYFALLFLTALVAFGSAEQVQEGVLVSYRNLGGMLAILLVLFAMGVSIRQDMRRH